MNFLCIRTVRLIGMIAFLSLCTLPATAKETVWLSIVATQTSIDKATAKAQSLQVAGTQLKLIDSSDCQNLRNNLFLVVAAIVNNQISAQQSVQAWRNRGVPDAYIRHCDIVHESRLALRIPLLHASILENSVNPINWNLLEAITQVKFISEDRIVVIAPQFQSDPEDVREGLRTRIYLLYPTQTQSIDLYNNCIDPKLTSNSSYMAVSCVTETAADNLLHNTKVFKLTDGTLIDEQSRCREPEFIDDQFTCQQESVDANGKLHLKPSIFNLSTK